MNVRHPHTQRLTSRVLALTLALNVIAPAAPLMAQEYGIIDDVRIGTSTQGPQIRIDFIQAAQYIGHTLAEQGRQLFIDLRLIAHTPSEGQLPQEQQLRLRPSGAVPITSVSYREEGRNRARLELNFSRPVRYQVHASSDFRGVTVTLIDEKVLPKGGHPESKPEPVASLAVEKRVAELMDEARKSLVDERNFAKAVTLYQQVLDQPANSRSREALELLGLARERLGQRAQAKAVYESYLERYPSGEASERVRQRLMSMVTAALPEQEKRRQEKAAADWDVYGSFSQYYLRNTVLVEDTPTETTTSAYSTDIDLIALRRSSESDTRMRITAGHYYDLLAEEENQDTRLSTLYAEHHDRDAGWWGRVGRQSSDHDGVLGRFDGLKLGYALSKRIEASVVAGYPVDSSRDPLSKDRPFAGMALDFGPFADSWEFSLYGMEQETASLVDRQAVGGELRYFSPALTLFGLADYDAFYEELNIGTLLANWTLKNELTLNATFDVRKTPTLTTRNALIGQNTGPVTALVPVEEMEALRALYSDEEIYQLARDRTAEIRTLTLGASRPISKRLRLAGDLTMMNTSATEASPAELGGVEAIPATDDEYFLNLQMIGTGVLNGDDLSTLGLRLSDTTTAQSAGIFASSRLPVGQRWRIYPRLRVDHRTWKTTDDTQWNAGPALRIEYDWNKIILQGEIGGEWVNKELPDDTERSLGIYGSIGYRYEF